MVPYHTLGSLLCLYPTLLCLCPSPRNRRPTNCTSYWCIGVSIHTHVKHPEKWYRFALPHGSIYFILTPPFLSRLSSPPPSTKEEKENIADIWAAYHDERADSLGTVMPGDALADLQAKAKTW